MHCAHVLRCLGFAGVLAVIVNCQTLPELARGVCGNGVKETDEDCDEVEENADNPKCGAPETAGACRYICGELADTSTADGGATDSGCALGYSCGTDSICRKRAADGPYVAGSSVALGADRMFAANLAGTGQNSVLAVSRDVFDLGYPRLLAFDRVGERTADQTLQGAFGLGGVSDLDGDGKDDVLFSRPDGLLLALGSDATTLRAVASDFIPLPAGAQVTLLTVPGSASVDTAGGRTSELLALVSNQAAPRDPSHTYLHGTEITVGPLADFDWQVPPGTVFGSRVSTLPDPAYLCERAVFAHTGGTEIDSVQACCPTVWSAESRTGCEEGQRLIRGPSGQRDRLAVTLAPIVYGPWSIDVDGDSRTDVVVATRPVGGALQIEVAFGGDTPPLPIDSEGTSTRALQSAPPGVAGATARATSVLPLYVPRLPTEDGPTEIGTLLDVGVETRDIQVLDAQNRTVTETRRFLTFVDANFVAHARYATNASSAGYQIGAARASSWTSARLASFNDDGLLDVIGGRTRAVDLDVGLGTPDLGLNLTSVRTGLSTEQLELADVDGDRVTDVLLTSNAGQNSSTLSVLFGRAGSSPNEVTAIGSFERVKQVVAAPLAFGLLGEDSAADIGIVTTTVSGDGAARVSNDSVSVLRSVGGRVPFSLYGLGAGGSGGGTDLDAIAFASTPVRRGSGGSDVVALGRDIGPPGAADVYRLWSGSLANLAASSSSTAAGSRLTPPVPGAAVSVLGFLEGPDDVGINALLRAIDLDGDGNEEVVGASSDVDVTTPVLFVGAYASTGYTLSLPPTPIAVTGERAPYYHVFGLEVVDVDHDGRDDVVVLLASAPAFQETDETDLIDLGPRKAVLVVVPNQNGQLNPAAATLLTPPDDPRAIAVGTIAPERGRELVVATTRPGPGGTASISVLHGSDFSVLYSEQRGADQPAQLGNARSLVVADVTGDGVDDLVVGTRERATVLRAVTENP